MGLLKSVVKKVAVATVVIVGKRIVTRIVSKVAEKMKSPPAAK